MTQEYIDIPGIAAAMNISIATAHHWLRRGKVKMPPVIMAISVAKRPKQTWEKTAALAAFTVGAATMAKEKTEKKSVAVYDEDKYMSMTEVCKITGMDRKTIDQRMKAGTLQLPEPETTVKRDNGQTMRLYNRAEMIKALKKSGITLCLTSADPICLGFIAGHYAPEKQRAAQQARIAIAKIRKPKTVTIQIRGEAYV